MASEQITIPVDPEAARAYREASQEDRRKLDLLLSLRLRSAMRPNRPLLEIMDDIARRAADRGLTQDTLNTILDDEHHPR